MKQNTNIAQMLPNVFAWYSRNISISFSLILITVFFHSKLLLIGRRKIVFTLNDHSSCSSTFELQIFIDFQIKNKEKGTRFDFIIFVSLRCRNACLKTFESFDIISIAT